MLSLLKPTSPEAKALQKIATAIDDVEVTIEELAAAPLAISDIERNVRNLLTVRADDHAKPKLKYFMRPGDSALPDVDLGLMYALFGEELIERITKYLNGVREELQLPEGLTSAQRRVEIDSLEAKLKKLTEQEERETLKLEALDLVVMRRADADPEILLKLWDE